MKKRSVIAVLAAALILAGCGTAKTTESVPAGSTPGIIANVDEVDEPESIDEDIETDVEAEYDDETLVSEETEEAAESVGSDLEGLPDEFLHYDYKADVRSTYHLDSVEALSDTLVEATYTNEEGRGIIIRKGATPEDAVLDYSVYGSEMVGATENVEEVVFTNYEGLCLLATWSANGYSYSILATDFDEKEGNNTGISLKTACDLINAVK